jgi:hypothetical protein
VTWTPVLEGTLRERALDLVGIIADDLRVRFEGEVAPDVAWLFEQRLVAEDDASFPAFAAPGVPGRKSRLAWCYGDPGVAGTLLVAGRWQAQAEDIAQRAALGTLVSPVLSYLL